MASTSHKPLSGRDTFCAFCANDNGNLQTCSGCKGPMYCSAECQRKHWKTHKQECTMGKKWYDRYRLCRDGSKHHGKLEVMTSGERSEGTGWGNIALDEAQEVKKLWETKYGCDPKRFFKSYPLSFRWTCCGTDGGMVWGCDHHGTGPQPCTCDFCKMGKALPDSIFDPTTATRRGLTLSRGPDPRSYDRVQAQISKIGRGMMGMDK